MFERYTESARRAIYFARAEASESGSPSIQTEHLLLGLLWEDAALRFRLMAAGASAPSVRGEVEARLERRAKTPATVGLPLNEECKRVLTHAAREADRLDHKHIGTEHLVLGILVAQKSFTAGILRRHGLDLSRLRQELEKGGAGGDAPE